MRPSEGDQLRRSKRQAGHPLEPVPILSTKQGKRNTVVDRWTEVPRTFPVPNISFPLHQPLCLFYIPDVQWLVRKEMLGQGMEMSVVF